MLEYICNDYVTTNAHGECPRASTRKGKSRMQYQNVSELVSAADALVASQASSEQLFEAVRETQGQLKIVRKTIAQAEDELEEWSKTEANKWSVATMRQYLKNKGETATTNSRSKLLSMVAILKGREIGLSRMKID